MPYQGRNFDPEYNRKKQMQLQQKPVQVINNYTGRNYDPNYKWRQQQQQQQQPGTSQNYNWQSAVQPQPQQPRQQAQQNQNSPEQPKIQQYSVDQLVNFLKISEPIFLSARNKIFFELCIAVKQNQLLFFSIERFKTQLVHTMILARVNPLDIELFITDVLYQASYLFLATNFGVYGCKFGELVREEQQEQQEHGEPRRPRVVSDFESLRKGKLLKIFGSDKVCRDLQFDAQSGQLSFVEGEFQYEGGRPRYDERTAVYVCQVLDEVPHGGQHLDERLRDVVETAECPSGIRLIVPRARLSVAGLYVHCHCQTAGGQLALAYRDLATSGLYFCVLEGGLQRFCAPVLETNRLLQQISFQQLVQVGVGYTFVLVSQQGQIVALSIDMGMQRMHEQVIMYDGRFQTAAGASMAVEPELLYLQKQGGQYILHCKSGRMKRLIMASSDAGIHLSQVTDIYDAKKHIDVGGPRQRTQEAAERPADLDSVHMVSGYVSDGNTVVCDVTLMDYEAQGSKSVLFYDQLQESKAVSREMVSVLTLE